MSQNCNELCACRFISRPLRVTRWSYRNGCLLKYLRCLSGNVMHTLVVVLSKRTPRFPRSSGAPLEGGLGWEEDELT